MLIEIVDSRRLGWPIICYESDVIPIEGDSISMEKTKQYPGFVGIVLSVSHRLYVDGLGQYPKAKLTVVLEMAEES